MTSPCTPSTHPVDEDEPVPVETVPLYTQTRFHIDPFIPGKSLQRQLDPDDPCDQRALRPSPQRADRTASIAFHLFDAT